MDRIFDRDNTVGVLSKALDVLDIVRNSLAGVTLTEISVALKYPKATVFRILSTLEIHGYVERYDGSRYRLTKNLGLPDSPDRTMERLLSAAQPVMQQLVEEHQETVNLAILDGGEIVVMHALESPLAVRMSSKAGNRRHIHSTALGKVLMAWNDSKEIERWIRLKGLIRLTPYTLRTPEAFIKELAKVRRQGFAEECEENELGGRCVAVPIHNPSQEVIAALSVLGPSMRMSDRKVRAVIRDLKPAGKRLSELLKRKWTKAMMSVCYRILILVAMETRKFILRLE